MVTLREQQDILGKLAFGMTKAEAHKKQICIDCKRKVELVQLPHIRDVAEYQLSGLCPKCFDSITKEAIDEYEKA